MMMCRWNGGTSARSLPSKRVCNSQHLHPTVRPRGAVSLLHAPVSAARD